MAKSSTRRIIVYLSLAALLIVVRFRIHGVSWQAGASLQLGLESRATAGAFIVGILSLLHFKTRNKQVFLIVGVGGIGLGILDLLHAYSVPAALADWGWHVSRLYLAGLFWLVWLHRGGDYRTAPGRWIRPNFIVWGAALFGVLCIVLATLLPGRTVGDAGMMLSPPVELVLALLFIAPLAGILRRTDWREQTLYHWLVMALIPAVLGQVLFASFTTTATYTISVAVLSFKLISYTLLFLGLLAESYQVFQEAQKGLEDAKQGLARAEALYSVSQSLIAPMSLQDVLQAIVESVVRTLPCERSLLLTLDQERQQVTQSVSYSRHSAPVHVPDYQELMEGLTGWVLRHDQPAISPSGNPDPRESVSVRQVRADVHTGAVVVVPLKTKGQTLGTLTAANLPSEPDFGAEDLERMEVMASHAAIAIENARLFDAAQAARDELEARVTQRTQELTEANQRLEAEIREGTQTLSALLESEARYRQLVESTNDMVISLDDDGRILFANRAWYEALGRSATEGAPANIFDMIHPESRPQCKKTLSRLKQSQGAEPIQARFLKEDGTAVILEGAVTRSLSDRERWVNYAFLREVTEKVEAQEALRASEEKFAKAFLSSPDSLIISTMADGTYVEVNDVFLRDTGYSREEIIGTRVADLGIWVDERDRERFVSQLRENGHVRDFDTGYRKKSGEIGRVRMSAEPIEVDGEPCILSISREISIQERKSALWRLLWRMNQAILNSDIEENISQALLKEIDKVLSREMLLVSITKHDLQHRISQSIMRNRSDVPFKGDRLFTSKDGKVSIQKLTLPLEISESLLGRQTTGESQIIHDLNEVDEITAFQVMKQIGGRSAMNVPLTVRGALYGSLSLVSDVPGAFREIDIEIINEIVAQLAVGLQQSQLRQELDRQQAFLRQVIEISPNFVFAKDREGRFTLVNQAMADFYGTTVESLLGTVDTDYYPESEAARYRATDIRVMDSLEEYFDPETLVTDPQQHEYWLQTIKRPILDESGKAVQVLGVATDITRLKQTEEALRAERTMLEQRVKERTAELSKANAELALAAKLKDEFLANMSHELRTPLNAIMGRSELLNEEVYGPVNDRQSASLNVIRESGSHLLELINDILDISKIEAGMLEISREEVSIEPACQASLRMVREDAIRKQQTISHSFDSAVKSIRADSRRLKQILVNLLSNAVKFTETGGQIGLTVTGNEDNDTVEFTVWDTGIGIAETDIERLFQPFIQVDSGLSRAQEGTGLGLSLVSRLAELHGGSVRVESEVGKGSRFTVSLPWGQAETKGLANDADSALSPGGFNLLSNDFLINQEVLVIEEDSRLSSQLTAYIEELGGTVSIHAGPEGALEKAAAADLILLNVQRPESPGWEILLQLKASASTRDIPVIAISDESFPHHRAAQVADGYVTIPVTVTHLHQGLRTALPGRVDDRRHKSGPLPHINRVLVAEDNEANISIIVDFLEAQRYQVSVARNGQEAIQMARSWSPDQILMDIQMPILDGMEAMKRIRDSQHLTEVPIVALTALAMPGDRERCLAAGANEYITKPVNLRHLNRLLKTLLSDE